MYCIPFKVKMIVLTAIRSEIATEEDLNEKDSSFEDIENNTDETTKQNNKDDGSSKCSKNIEAATTKNILSQFTDDTKGGSEDNGHDHDSDENKSLNDEAIHNGEIRRESTDTSQQESVSDTTKAITAREQAAANETSNVLTESILKPKLECIEDVDTTIFKV